MNLSGHFTKIFLCQVVPNNEQKVIERFAACHNSDDQIATDLIIGFGEFNLIGFTSGPFLKMRDDTVFAELAGLVRDYQEVFCFEWEGLNENWDIVKRSPARALTFFKLNHSHRGDVKTDFGITKQILQDLKKKYTDCSAVVLGNIGWPELVIYWGADKFQSIDNSVFDLRTRYRWPNVSKFLPSTVAVDDALTFSNSYTIPAAQLINWVDCRETLTVPSLLSIDLEREDLTIFVKQSGNRLFKNANHKLKITITAVLGEYDYRIKLSRDDSGTKLLVQELVDLLQDIRKSPDVISTYTRISFCVDADHQTNSDLNPNEITDHTSTTALITSEQDYSKWVEYLNKLQHIEDRIGNNLVRVAPDLTQVLATYSQIKTRREFSDLFEDMYDFVEYVFSTLGRYVFETPKIAWLNAISRHRFDRFSHVSRMFQLAFDQRFNGAQLGMTNSSRSIFGLRPFGVQRVLKAARNVAKWSLAQVSQDDPQNTPFQWKGFTVFGYPVERLRLPFAVINLRSANLLRPDQWWTITHACGHELYISTQLDQHRTCSLTIDRLEKYFCEAGWEKGRCRSEAERIIEELFADVFTYHIAFDSSWVRQKNATWYHMAMEFEGQSVNSELNEHILRTLFLFFYDLKWREVIPDNFKLRERSNTNNEDSKPKDTNQDDLSPHKYALEYLDRYSSMEELFKMIISYELATVAERCRPLFAEIDIGRIVSLFELVEHMQLFIKKLMKRRINSLSALNSNRASRLACKLQEGSIIFDHQANPAEIIAAATICSIEQFESPNEYRDSPWQLAAILSLLDYA